MDVVLEELDSRAFGRNVLKIINPEEADFQAFEQRYILTRSPYYVYVKIPAESLRLIHHFENHGFRFVEFQLEMTKRLPAKKYDTSMFDSILNIEEVTSERDIEPILQLADAIFNIDRIYLDPEIDVSLAKQRYRLYITRSWQSPREHLVIFTDRRDNSLIGFHTHLKTDSTNIIHFLGGVAPAYKGSGVTIGTERLLFNRWIDEGIKKLTTHISLSNYKIMEAEYKAFDFKPKQSSAVLRKIYPG